MQILFRRNGGCDFPFAGLLFGFCCLAVLLSAGPALATTYHVRVNGTGDGLTWLTASSDLAGVLNRVESGDEIWVAEGTYKPTEDSSDRGASFVLKSGVALYGGFAGVEASRDQRDFAANETILTGDLESNDVVSENGTVTYNGNNTYHVVYCNDVDDTAVLDGFTVKGGNADDGGNIYGGGMYNESSSPQVSNCTFSGNSAARGGGGMYNESSSPEVTNCTFSANSAAGDLGGGGMYNEFSSPRVSNCTFSGNSAGGVFTYGGGGMCNMESSSPQVSNCTFSGNSTSTGGGGMSNRESSSPEVSNSTFSGNSADWGGGGICNSNSSNPTIWNCTFSGNTVSDGGLGGGGMYSESSSPQALNCTFSVNSAPSGGGMYNKSSSPTAINCIFWGNADGEVVSVEGSDLKLACCVVQNPSAADFTAISGCTAVISGDPRLGPLADNGGSTLTCALDTDSSAIDAGLASFDIEGDSPDLGNVVPSADQRGFPRPYGDGFDIGAFEAFEAVWYAITVSVDVGGTVSAEPHGVITESAGFSAYSTPTFIITPEESMDLAAVRTGPDSSDLVPVDIASLDVISSRVYGYTLQPLCGDRFLEVTFTDRQSPVTGAVSGDHGSVVPTNVDVGWGQDQTVTVTADEHYHIDWIEVDGTPVGFGDDSRGCTVTFRNVMAPHGVEAAFAIDRHDLAVTTGGTGSGTVSSAGGTYPYGTEVTLTATPADSSTFTGWSGVDLSDGVSATVTMTGDRTVTANFVLRTFTVTATAGGGGTVSPTSASVAWGQNHVVQFTPCHGYRVSDVKVDGVSAGSGESYTFGDVWDHHTVHVTFAVDGELLDQGLIESLDFGDSGDASEMLLGGTASVDLPSEVSVGGLCEVVSADLGGFWIKAVQSEDISGAGLDGVFLSGVSFDVEASTGGGVGFLPVSFELVVPEELLSTECLESISDLEETVGLTGAFLSRVMIQKVFSDDTYDLFSVVLDAGHDPLQFFSVSRNEDGDFLVMLVLLVVDAPAGDVAAVQAVPASGDCRFLIFDGTTDGHYRDPIVALERSSGDSEGGNGGGCSALPVSGLALLLLPLLGLMKK